VHRVMAAYRNNTQGLYWIKVNGSNFLNNLTRYPELAGKAHRSLRNVVRNFVSSRVTRHKCRHDSPAEKVGSLIDFASFR
jgi:hypothetical protein